MTYQCEICYPVKAWCMETTYTCGLKQSDFQQLVLEHPSIGLRVIKNRANISHPWLHA